jgi:hypothetical protein
MVRRIDSNGLTLNLMKLNGKLKVRFSSDATYTVHYIFRGTDIEDTCEWSTPVKLLSDSQSCLWVWSFTWRMPMAFLKSILKAPLAVPLLSQAMEADLETCQTLVTHPRTSCAE